MAELESRPVSAWGGDLRKIRRERNELKDAVKSFEAELTQIQMDTKMLAEDRDNFKLLYEQVRALASSPGLRGEGKGRPGDEAMRAHTHTHTHMDRWLSSFSGV